MNKIHCSLSYHQTPPDEVESFALGIKAGYFGNNPPFTVQPFTELFFEGLITDYVNKRAAYVNGGETQKGPFLLAKTALMNAMDSLAIETDKIALGDTEIIILAGFTPTQAAGESTKPEQCVVTVKRGIAGELIPGCAIIDNAKHYGCIMTEGAPLPEGVIINGDGRIVWNVETPEPVPGALAAEPMFTSLQLDLTDQRVKHFLNLKHDVMYYFYFYAVNAKGVVPLSEVVSMVCW